MTYSAQRLSEIARADREGVVLSCRILHTTNAMLNPDQVPYSKFRPSLACALFEKPGRRGAKEQELAAQECDCAAELPNPNSSCG